MRLSLIIPVLILALAPDGALARDLDAKSAIRQVTVFPSGAEILREAEISVPAGDHTLVLRDLPERLIDTSLRVEGEGDGLVLGSIDSRRIYVDILPEGGQLNQQQRQQIEDEIEKLQDEKTLLEARVRMAETQRRLMEKLADMPAGGPRLPVGGAGANGQFSADNWGAIYDLIGQRMAAADDLIHRTRIEIREKNEEIEKLRKRLSQQPAKRERVTEVRVAVNAGSEIKGKLRLKYQVREARWRPFYDARLSTGEDGKPAGLKLARRGGIRQWSGEAWNDVKLSLSTTSPQKGSQAPVIFPEKVDILQPMPAPRPLAKKSVRGLESLQGRTRRMMAPRAEMAEDAAPAGLAMAAKPKMAVERGAAVRNYAFQAVFDIPGSVSIPASGDEKKVAISFEQLQPTLKIRTVPKLNSNAFLYAEFTHDKQASPLLPGRVALYRDGVYTGDGNLPLVPSGDKHSLGFGVDDAVKVARVEVKRSKGETGLISTSKVDDRRYSIKVTNLHKTAVDVEVLDQIPYTVNEKVVVTLSSTSTKPSRRNVDDKRGVLAWDFSLAPGKERLIRLDYSVAWPSDKRLTGGYGR